MSGAFDTHGRHLWHSPVVEHVVDIGHAYRRDPKLASVGQTQDAKGVVGIAAIIERKLGHNQTYTSQCN